MRHAGLLARCSFALALLVLAMCAAVQAQDTPAPSDQPGAPSSSIGAKDDDDDGPPRAAKPEAEPRAEREDRDERRADRDDRGGGKPFGQFRRPDPFDSDDDESKSAATPAADAAAGVIVCLAGCDGERGAVVYKKP
jgi:hypothetical protein